MVDELDQSDPPEGPDSYVAYAGKVHACKDAHPDWTYTQIAIALGSSRSAVGRVFRPDPEPRKHHRKKHVSQRSKAGRQRAPRRSASSRAVPNAQEALLSGLISKGEQPTGTVGPGPLVERMKKRLAGHPAVADLNHLPSRLRRLIDTCVAEIEGGLATGGLREKVGALKYAVEAYVAVTGVDRGTNGSAAAAAASVNLTVRTGGSSSEIEVHNERVLALARRMGNLGLGVVMPGDADRVG